MSRNLVLLVDSPLPRVERAFCCFSESQAEAISQWLAKNGIDAYPATIEEVFKPQHTEIDDEQSLGCHDR